MESYGWDKKGQYRSKNSFVTCPEGTETCGEGCCEKTLFCRTTNGDSKVVCSYLLPENSELAIKIFASAKEETTGNHGIWGIALHATKSQM